MRITRHFIFGIIGLSVIAGAVYAGSLDDYLKKNRSKADAYATIEGVPVAKNAIDNLLKSQGMDPAIISKDQLKGVVEEAILIEVLVQEAMRRELDKTELYKLQMEAFKRQLAVKMLAQDYSVKNPIPDAKVKEVYDENVKRMGSKEYRARHILVKSKEEAESITKSIKDGESFEKLAAEKSLDPSGKKGGDLGWFNSGNMVKPFADAVAKLKKGQMTDNPVQSRFGWHVIRLDDLRDVQVPAMAQVKPQLLGNMRQQQFQDFAKGLMGKAKIKRNIQ
jgi:peptidyl-prolyl cis-trans isomerase C